jgi:hypothetical protein
MNCFNIREIQTLLKARFYADLLNETDHRLFLAQTAIGLRFKLQDINFFNPSMLLLNRFNLLAVDNDRSQLFTSKSLTTNNIYSGKYNQFNDTRTVSSIDTHSTPTYYLFVSLFNPTQTVSFYLGNPISTFVNLVFQIIVKASCKVVYTFTTIIELLSFKTSFWIHTNTWLGILTRLPENYFSLFENWKTIIFYFRAPSSQLLPAFLPNISFQSEFITTPVINLFLDPTVLLKALFSGLKDFFYMTMTGLRVPSNLPSLNTTALVESVTLIYTVILWNYNNTVWQTIANTPIHAFKTSFNSPTLGYSTNQFQINDLTNQNYFSFQEQSSNYRYQRLQNPIFRYDFKLGNYMPDEAKKKAPFLYTTIHDLTTGVRKPSWAISSDFLKFLEGDLASYLNYFSRLSEQGAHRKLFVKHLSEVDSSVNPKDPFWANISHAASYYNFFLLLSDGSLFFNHRWLAVNSLNQKFHKMFLTNSLQQRIHGNWRQLKFTREAWRCKLLAARHQNTTHKRYLNEDFTVWSVERNAKDLLPGWAMITPFSARTRFTAVGKVDIGLFGVFLVINASIVAASNFLITYRYLATLNNRKMRDARSFFTEGVMVASWMIIAANPMLSIAILMLLSDRHWQTSFFDYSGGGDTVMFQHMFWFFGHPEVYIILIPTFGFNNTIFSFYLRKRVSARASLLYSMYTIAFLGFFVWGHHMYMVGLAHTTRMLFSTLTVMISIPAATKLMHWSVTLVNSTFAVELPFVFQILFVFSFVSGGISGMALAHTGLDVLFHDSFYVIGHFHVMLAGAGMYGSWGAFYFYFPAIWGVKFSRIWGYLHCLYYVTGQFMIVIPMMWLGYSGMPRRVLDYPASMGGWHAVTSAGTLLSVGGIMAFFVMLFDSLRQGRAATRNTFGISRFNTRLNFYLYVGSRTLFLQRKGWYISRFNMPTNVQLNYVNYTNFEYLEVTLLSYSFLHKQN